jgi:hypothetical protein
MAVEQGTARARGSLTVAHAKRIARPCGRACSGEWCHRLRLELGAIFPGCARAARHRGHRASGDTKVWCQPLKCWATKVWHVQMGSNGTKSLSGSKYMKIHTFAYRHSNTFRYIHILTYTCRYIQIQYYTCRYIHISEKGSM